MCAAENPQKRATFTLVVEGKPSPFPGGEPQMTPDGLHVFTKRQVPGPTPTTEVFLDGKRIMLCREGRGRIASGAFGKLPRLMRPIVCRASRA